jgi:hypothetical protein
MRQISPSADGNELLWRWGCYRYNASQLRKEFLNALSLSPQLTGSTRLSSSSVNRLDTTFFL